MAANWKTITVQTTERRWHTSQTHKMRYRTVNEKREWEIEFKKELYLCCTPVDDLIASLKEDSKNLSNAIVDAEKEYGYYGDDGRYVVTLSGWSTDIDEKVLEAAEAELAALPIREKEAHEIARQRAADQMRQLREQFPDLG